MEKRKPQSKLIKTDELYDFLEGTVEVEVFEKRLTFCLPKSDFEYLKSRIFDGRTPSEEEMSEFVESNTSGRSKDWRSWKDIAYELHEAIQRERSLEKTNIRKFPTPKENEKDGFCEESLLEM